MKKLADEEKIESTIVKSWDKSYNGFGRKGER